MCVQSNSWVVDPCFKSNVKDQRKGTCAWWGNDTEEIVHEVYRSTRRKRLVISKNSSCLYCGLRVTRTIIQCEWCKMHLPQGRVRLSKNDIRNVWSLNLKVAWTSLWCLVSHIDCKLEAGLGSRIIYDPGYDLHFQSLTYKCLPLSGSHGYTEHPIGGIKTHIRRKGEEVSCVINLIGCNYHEWLAADMKRVVWRLEV